MVVTWLSSLFSGTEGCDGVCQAAQDHTEAAMDSNKVDLEDFFPHKFT